MIHSVDFSLSSHASFLALLDEVRQLLGYTIRQEDPEPGEELVMEMTYGGFDFSIVHSLAHRPAYLLIECRFGLIPEGREFPIMKKLLQMNCALAELDGSTFCIETDSGDLIYTISQNIADLDGKSLLYKMTEIVWHGRRWLETRFIQTQEVQRTDSVIPVALA